MKKSEWPERGEIVVVKIKRVMDYGAIANLEEYPEKEGFIHISQVATSWVKNIRSFVSEGQLRVALVKRFDPSRNTIDISLRDVSNQKEKRKLEDWKREKKADKLFERICRELKEDHDESYEKVARVLEEHFGDLFSAFENASTYGGEAFKDLKIPEKWKKALIKKAEESIVAAEVIIRGDLFLTSKDSNGVEVIKEALKEAKGEGVKLEYISAPKYRLEVTAKDYEEAEKNMKEVYSAVISTIQKAGGEGRFERLKT